MHGSKPILGVFAKWPSIGSTKTRLASADPMLGVRIARAFLLDTIGRMSSLDAHRVLVFAPSEARADFAALSTGRYELEPQVSGDLGERLRTFFDLHVERRAPGVVAIGTDSPTLPLKYVDLAFRALVSADVVIGPAVDGGYYLIGCAARVPPVFEGIDWGSSRVLQQTVKRLAKPEWRVVNLPPWYDVDTSDDWSVLADHVAALRGKGSDPGIPYTEAMLHEIGASIGGNPGAASNQLR